MGHCHIKWNKKLGMLSRESSRSKTSDTVVT